LLSGTMANNSRMKKKTTDTTKKLHPQLQAVKAILRDLLAEFDSDEVKRIWQMIRQEA
jgi:hypothetical protein